MSIAACGVLLLGLWIADVSFGAAIGITAAVFVSDVVSHAIWKTLQS